MKLTTRKSGPDPSQPKSVTGQIWKKNQIRRNPSSLWAYTVGPSRYYFKKTTL